MHPLLQPFIQMWTSPPRQWHPVLVHFPIAFLVMEAVVLAIFGFNKEPGLERCAYRLLQWSVLSSVAVALLGIHDSGLDLGEGNLFWLGLQDRWANIMRFQSSVTVHSWLAAGLMALTAARLAWRKLTGPLTLSGLRGCLYAALVFLGIWVLSAAGYVGGLISHQ